MAERATFGQGYKITSNYVIVPGQCPTCTFFSANSTSNWGPYFCDGKSNATSAVKAHTTKPKGQTFDYCKCYESVTSKEKQKEQKKQYKEKYYEPKKETKINRQNKQKEKKELDETFEKRKMQLLEKLNSANEYGLKNNLICVDICLPKLSNTKTYIHDEIISFLESYNKIELFINASDYKLDIIISIHKKGIEKILESNKMKEYILDNDNNEMFVFKNKDKYVILSPEVISELEYEENNETVVTVDRTPYRILFKSEELIPFLKKYNKLLYRII